MRRLNSLFLCSVLLASCSDNNVTSEPKAADMRDVRDMRDMRTSQGDVPSDQDMGAVADETQPAADMKDASEEDMSPAPDMPPMTARDPGEQGVNGQVTVMTKDVTVSGRTIPVTLYTPQGAGPFPLVALHHGFNLAPSLYASYGNHLASWGFMVAMPEAPGSLLSPTPHSELAELFLGVVESLRQEGQVTDVVLAGHSLGGKVAFLAAARATPSASIKGVFGIDAVDALPPTQRQPSARYPSVAPELMGDFNLPFVSVGERVNASCSGAFCQACAPEDENFSQYYAAATTAPALEAEIMGANHVDFLDNPNCGFTCSVCTQGTLDADKTRLITKRLLTAFALVYLQGTDAYKPWLGGSAFAMTDDAGQVILQRKNGF